MTEIQSGRDVAFWLDKAYAHLDIAEEPTEQEGEM